MIRRSSRGCAHQPIRRSAFASSVTSSCGPATCNWALDQVGPDGQVRPASEWREAHTLEAALRDSPPGQVVVLRDLSLIEPE